MSDLKFHEKRVFERLFQMESGYVMTFSDASLQAFFEDFEININAEKYLKKGTSKANKLRSVWTLESNSKVAEINRALMLYWKVDTTTELYQEAEDIIEGLLALGSNKQPEVSPKKRDARRSVKTIIQEATYLIIRNEKEKGSYPENPTDIMQHAFIEDLFGVLEKYQGEDQLDFKLADNERTRERWVTEAVEKDKKCTE